VPPTVSAFELAHFLGQHPKSTVSSEPCTSEVLLAELLDLLSRGKFAVRLIQVSLTPQGIVDDLRRWAVVVSPTDTPRVVPTVPDDDHVIAAAVAVAVAVAGQADLIASGDKRDLLPMVIINITVCEAIKRLEAKAKT